MSWVRRWRPRLYNYYTSVVRPKIPPRLRRLVGRPYGVYVFWRVGPRATSLLGPRYKRSRDRIDVDITWDCNLRCFHCNRSCEQAPTQDRMTVGQIRRFLEDSRERDIRWKEIHIIGGEPTLHPDIDEIMRLVLEYRDRYSPGTNVKLTSNGHGAKVAGVLQRIPKGVDIRDTKKDDRCQAQFVPFNLAPRETADYAQADFRNGCAVTRDSGIGLSPNGYYPCVVAGGIDRVFGFNRGRKSLPAPEDGMEQELAHFCSLCGFFRLNYTIETDGEPLMSPAWERAYAAWRQKPPVLTRFPELP